MIEVKFRKVTLNELIQLRELSISTFSESFAQVNTPKDMEMYLTEHMSVAKLEGQLTNPNSEFYFAFHQNAIAGYIKVNIGNAQNEQRSIPSLELERIYVVTQFQGKGIGKQLMNEAISLTKAKGLSSIWLGVWEHNKKALHFYQNMGFKKFGSHPFLLGEDLQTDLLMEKEV